MEPDSLARFRVAVAHAKRGKELDKLIAALAKLRAPGKNSLGPAPLHGARGLA